MHVVLTAESLAKQPWGVPFYLAFSGQNKFLKSLSEDFPLKVASSFEFQELQIKVFYLSICNLILFGIIFRLHFSIEAGFNPCFGWESPAFLTYAISQPVYMHWSWFALLNIARKNTHTKLYFYSVPTIFRILFVVDSETHPREIYPDT